MKLNTLRIPCLSLASSEDFYTQTLGLKKLFGSREEGFIGIALENAQLLLEPEEPGEFESGRYLGFSLEVSDLDAFYEDMIKKGVRFTHKPKTQDWGAKMTHVIDPNNNSFSVINASLSAAMALNPPDNSTV